MYQMSKMQKHQEALGRLQMENARQEMAQRRQQMEQQAALAPYARQNAMLESAKLGIQPPPGNMSETPEAMQARLAPLLQRYQTEIGLGQKKIAAETESAQALASQRGAMAKMLTGEGWGRGPSIATDQESGFQFVRTPSAMGPKFTALPNQGLSYEAVGRKTLAEDAILNLDEISAALESDSARTLMLKAGGSFDKLKSLGDPAAEKLANAIFQAADAEARVKTGAAINMTEMQLYFKDLINPIGTMEGNKDRINKKKRYFQRAVANLTEGKAVRRRGDMTAGTNPADKGTIKMRTPDGKIWDIAPEKVRAAEARGAKRL